MTVAALVSLGRTEQLRPHLRRAMDNGLGKDELLSAMTHLASYAAEPGPGEVTAVAVDEGMDVPPDIHTDSAVSGVPGGGVRHSSGSGSTSPVSVPVSSAAKASSSIRPAASASYARRGCGGTPAPPALL